MESIHKLEKTVAGWYKNVPHLPAGGQKWLAENVWWIALISLVLTVLSIFPMIAAVLLVGGVAGGLGAAYGGAYSAALVGTALLAVWVTIAFLLLEAVILGIAISPLKDRKKKGWDMLFILALINVASVVASGLIGFNFMALVWGLLWSAVGAYFLFEIHGHFGPKEKATHHAPATKKTDEKKTAKA